MSSHRYLMLALVVGLAFGCFPAPNQQDHELTLLVRSISEIAGDLDQQEGAALLLFGSTLQASLPKRQDQLALPVWHEQVAVVPAQPVEAESVQIVGVLLRDVPEAGAKAGDRVVFRPDHPDWRRRCVVMHTTEAAHFLTGLADGTIEIIANQNGGDDPRQTLLDQIPHPPAPLSLAS